MSHCPICARESDPKYRPFCSRRCADIDLGKWLTGSYVIAAPEADNPEELSQALAEADAKKRQTPLDSDQSDD